MLRNKISHHSNILGKKSPYNVKGKFHSIYYLGYISISHWNLFGENLTLPLRNEIDKIIYEINNEFNTNFNFSIRSIK
jgi:hypothetical protein